MSHVVRSPSIPAGIRQAGAPQAVLAGAAVIFLLASSVALFPSAALGAFRVWVVSPTFNHCFLVLPLALFLIWNRRTTLAYEAPEPDSRAAFVVLALSIAWLAASLASILEAQQFVILSMVQAALFGVLGGPFYRKLAAPFLYLYFLVPSGAYLIPALQSFTAWFAVTGLHLLRIPVFSNGAVIEIPAGTFAVAEACAGLRFLVAAVAFGVFFSVITYRSWWRRAAFIALSIVTPIVANGFRALGLIAVGQWIGDPAAALADHLIYGWVFFSLVLVMLVGIGQLFSDRSGEEPAEFVSRRPYPVAAKRLGRMVLVGGACLLAAAVGPLTAAFVPADHITLVPAAAPHVVLWRETTTSPEWKPIVEGAARTYSQSFVRGPYRLDRFIALYRGRGPGGKLISSTNRDADERIWSFNASSATTFKLRGRDIPVRVSTWLRGPEKRVVWSFYDVGGRYTVGVWQAKWDAFYAYLSGNQCVSAYVAISAITTDENFAARGAGDLLAATEPLASYLCNPTRDRSLPGTGTAANSRSRKRSE